MIETMILLTVMLLLLAAKGFFSGSEIALVSSDKLRLRSLADRGNKGAALVLRLFEKPESLLATTLIGTNIATMTLTVLGATLMIELVGRGGDLYATLLLTPIMLILGEIVPKSVYQQKADTIAPIVIKPLAVFRGLMFPLVWSFSWIGQYIARRFGPQGVVPSPYVTRQRLRLMLQTSQSDAANLDRDRIRRAIRLSDMTVGEAMVPLVQVVGAPRSVPMSELLRLGRETGHRRIPLYEDNMSNIVAIATWTIWEEAEDNFAATDPADLAVTPHFASTIQRLDELLPILLERADHMAVVVDEFGTAAGVVTIEDLMRILLGDVALGIHLGPQERSRAAHVIEDAGDVFYLPARMRLAEVSELLDVDLPAREFHTLGGLLTSRLRRIPATGDTLDIAGFRFIVVEADARAALQVRVEPADSAEAGDT